jgi:hypothetical protein
VAGTLVPSELWVHLFFIGFLVTSTTVLSGFVAIVMHYYAVQAHLVVAAPDVESFADVWARFDPSAPHRRPPLSPPSPLALRVQRSFPSASSITDAATRASRLRAHSPLCARPLAVRRGHGVDCGASAGRAAARARAAARHVAVVA